MVDAAVAADVDVSWLFGSFHFIAMCCGQMNKKWELIVLLLVTPYQCLENFKDGLWAATFWTFC